MSYEIVMKEAIDLKLGDVIEVNRYRYEVVSYRIRGGMITISLDVRSQRTETWHERIRPFVALLRPGDTVPVRR